LFGDVYCDVYSIQVEFILRALCVAVC